MGIIRIKCGNTIVIFRISNLKLVKNQSFMKNKNFRFGNKNALFRLFSSKIWKHFWNQNLPISQNANCGAKRKNFRFGTKNALVFFKAEEKSIFLYNEPEFFKKLIFKQKGKALNLGLKLPYLCIFRLDIQKTIVLFEIFCQKFIFK